MKQSTPLGLGHNRAIPELLSDRYAEELQTAAELASKELPATCEVDDRATLDLLSQHVRDCRELFRDLDGIRAFEKGAFDVAARDIQGFFNPSLDRVEASKRAAEAVITARQRRAEEIERQRRFEAAERERAEADRRAAEAARLENAGKTVVAEQLHEYAEAGEAMANQMERSAAASSADLTRTQTSGGTVSAKGVWTFSIVGGALRADLGKLGDHFTQPDLEKAIRSFMAAEKKAGRDPVLDGVLFSRETRAVIR